MFQNMKMYLSENKVNRKFATEKYFSRNIFPDFPDIQSKFLISLISRLAVNPE